MSKGLLAASAVATIIISAVVAAVEIIHGGPALAGPHLAVVTGTARDPFLLTRPFESLLLHHCSSNAYCVRAYNGVAYVLLIGAMAYVSTLLHPRSKAAAAMIAVASIGISPLSAALVLDPLGIAMTVSLGLVVLAALDLSGGLTLPLIARCALILALMFQNPALTIAAAVYALLIIRSSARWSVAPLCAAILAAATLGMLGLIGPAHIDELASPAAIVALGACIFIGGPLSILVARYRLYAAVGMNGGRIWSALVFAFATLAGALFASSGDPALYWISAESAFLCTVIAALKCEVGWSRYARSAGLFAIFFIVQVLLLLTQHHNETSVALAASSRTLVAISAGDKSLCLAADPIGHRYLLANGSLLQMYRPRAPIHMVSSVTHCTGMSAITRVVQLSGVQLTDWGAILPLIQAYDLYNTATVVPTGGGAVYPTGPADTTGRLGAFENGAPSPMGQMTGFTILAGHSYTTRCAHVSMGQKLSFAVTTIPGSPATNISVDSLSKTLTTRPLLAALLPKSAPIPTYTWERFTVPLKGLVGCIRFRFTVIRAPNGPQTWTTFVAIGVR